MSAPGIHLDTSFLIQALVSGSGADRALRQWLGSGRPLAMSSIAWAEFLCGPVSPEQAELAAHVVGDRLPFGAEEAPLAARLYNEAGRRRGSLTDCMIAAVACRHGAELATLNRDDFRRFESAGLRLAAV